mgnify:CR=1 FL=1
MGVIALLQIVFGTGWIGHNHSIVKLQARKPPRRVNRRVSDVFDDDNQRNRILIELELKIRVIGIGLKA